VYDAFGMLVQRIDPLGRTVGFDYDLLGRLTRETDALGNVTEYEYDARGNVILVRDADGHETRYEYDALSRLVKQIDPLGGIVSYTYDAVGNRTSLTDPAGNTTTWVYDGLNRVIEETNELGHTRYFAYDAAGNLVQQIDRQGRVIQYVYDARGNRIAEEWYTDIDDTTADHTFTFSYDTLGQLTFAGDVYATYTYVYDTHLAGRIVEITHDLAVLPFTITVSQQFDALGRRTQVADDLGGVIDYGYDALSRMTQATWTVNSAAAAQINFTHNALGQTTSITRQAGAGAPIVATHYTYDTLARLTSLVHTVDDGLDINTLSAYAWAYDNLNRLVSYAGPEGTLSYDYDATGQLLAVDGFHEEEYSYDANGNRTLAGYVIGPNNQLLADGVFTYTYDNEGNRLTKTRISSDPADDFLTEYTWDHRNRLTRVVIKNHSGVVTASADYTYDVFDRLIVRVVDHDGAGSQNPVQSATIYDHTGRYEHGRALDEVFADFGRDADTGDWSLTSRYLYGSQVDQILARWDAQSGNTSFHLADHQGSVRQNVDGSTGIVVNEITYDAFGNILSESNPTAGDRFKYTAREWDQLVGLRYHRARWIDPVVAQWLNPDPISFASGQGLCVTTSAGCSGIWTLATARTTSWRGSCLRRRMPTGWRALLRCTGVVDFTSFHSTGRMFPQS
jgi:RHS repeat-associated protein